MRASAVENLKLQGDRRFWRINLEIHNGRLLEMALRFDNPKFIVSRLKEIESRDDWQFWEDAPLMNLFERHAQTARAPMDPVDRVRWAALVCIAAAKIEGFAYGNVVTEPDYLPEDSPEFTEYEQIYGPAFLNNIREMRNQLRSNQNRL